MVERLPDWAYTDNELLKIAVETINPSRYTNKPLTICWYHILVNGEFTGKAMLLAVESVVDGLESVNRVLADTGLSVIIGEYGKESYTNKHRVDCIYVALEHWNYASTIEFIGNDKVFSYEEWMAKLVN